MTTHEPPHNGGADNESDPIASIQRAEQAERLATVSDFGPSPRKRRRWLKVGGVMTGLVLICALLAPMMAGPLIKPMVERRLGESLRSTVRIDSMSLNWLGGQRIEGLQILDGSLQEQARVSVGVNRPLLSLVRSPMNLGTIQVSGAASLVEREDGSWSPLPPSSGDTSAEIRVPTDLAFKLELKGVDLAVAPLTMDRIELRGVSGTLDVERGGAASAMLQGVVFQRGGESRVDLALTIQDAVDSQGALDLAGASAELTLNADAVAPLLGGFAPALGREIGAGEASVQLSLASSGGSVSSVVDCEQASVDFDLDLARTDAGWRISLVDDSISARIGGPVLAAVAPAFRDLTQSEVAVGDGRAFRLDRIPGATLTLSRAAATIDPRTWGLSDTRFEMVLETEQLSGTLGESTWSIEPVLATAATRNLIDGVDLEAVASVTLDGSRAGDVSVLGDGLRVIEADGTFVRSAENLFAGSRATVDVTEITTAVVEPLVAPFIAHSGFVLSRDLGPVASAEMALTSGDRTGLRVGIESDNIDATLGFHIEDGLLRTTDETSRIAVRSASALLTQWLAPFQAKVNEGAAVEVRLGSFAFDLRDWRRAGRLNLGSLSGLINASVGSTAGRVEIDGIERGFLLRPSELELDLRMMPGRATLVSGASLEIDGRPAGTLNASVAALDVLEADGSLKPGVPSLSGEVAVRGFRSDLLDPWLASTAVRSTDLFGSAADIIVIGTRDGEAVQLEASLRSGGLEGGGDFVVSRGVIESVGTVRLEHQNAGLMVGSALPGALGADPQGKAELTLTSLRWGPRGLESFDATIEALEILIQGDEGRSLSVERINAAARLAEGVAEVEVNGIGAMDELPVVIGGGFSGPLSLSAPFAALPQGRLDLTIPTSVAGLLDATRFDAVHDVVGLGVGDTVTLGLMSDRDRITIEGRGSSDATRVDIAAETSSGSIRLTNAEMRTTVTAEAMRQLQLASVARSGRSAGRLSLSSPVEVVARCEPFEIVRDGALVLNMVAPVRLEASGSVRGVATETVLGSDGLPRTLPTGELGVEGLLIDAALPLGAMLASGDAELDGRLHGTVTGNEGAPIVQLAGAVAAEFQQGELDGPVRLEIDLPEVDAGLVDDSLATDSFFAGLFGATLSGSIELAGIAERGRVADAGLSVEFSSPRLSTENPITLDIAADRVVLAEPMAIECLFEPSFVTRHLLHQPVGAERVRLAEPIAARASVDELVLGRGDGVFRAGVFRVHADVSAPVVVFDRRGEVEQGVPITAAEWIRSDFSPLVGEMRTEEDGSLQLDLAASRDGEQSLVVMLGMAGLQTGEGVFGITIEGTNLPTAVLDGAADAGGGLAEVVGPTARMRLSVQNLSRQTGDLSLSIVGDRASGRVIGTIHAGVFEATEPVTASIDEIRPQLGARLSRAVPALGQVNKTREDGPATLTATGVRMSFLDGEPFAQLDADFTIDVGTARFRASAAFGELLRVARQPTSNEVGRKLEPMVGTVRQGLISYDRFKIPLGDYTLLSEGEYHLATKQTDITTYVPLSALSDQALGILSRGLSSRLARLIPGLERATMTPWRIRGTPGDLMIRPDFDALASDLAGLLNPINLIDGIVGGIGSAIGG